MSATSRPDTRHTYMSGGSMSFSLEVHVSPYTARIGMIHNVWSRRPLWLRPKRLISTRSSAGRKWKENATNSDASDTALLPAEYDRSLARRIPEHALTIQVTHNA